MILKYFILMILILQLSLGQIFMTQERLRLMLIKIFQTMLEFLQDLTLYSLMLVQSQVSIVNLVHLQEQPLMVLIMETS